MRLDNCITTVRGVSYKPADLHRELDTESVVLLRANNIADGKINHDDVQYVDLSKVKEQQYLRRGDILVCAASGSKKLVGKAALAKDEMSAVFGAFCLVLRPGNSVELAYLGHYFQSLQYRNAIEEVCTGSNINNLKPAHFFELDVPIPSKPAQHAAIKRLDSIRSQITRHQALQAQLDEIVKSRFVEMFGDPIENPFGWDARPLDKLGELRNGVNFKSVDAGTEIRCLGVSDFKDRYQISEMELISIISLNGKPNENQMLRDGDIVFVRSNGNKQLVGRCLAVFPGNEEVTFSGFCISFRNETTDFCSTTCLAA